MRMCSYKKGEVTHEPQNPQAITQDSPEMYPLKPQTDNDSLLIQRDCDRQYS